MIGLLAGPGDSVAGDQRVLGAKNADMAKITQEAIRIMPPDGAAIGKSDCSKKTRTDKSPENNTVPALRPVIPKSPKRWAKRPARRAASPARIAGAWTSAIKAADCSEGAEVRCAAAAASATPDAPSSPAILPKIRSMIAIRRARRVARASA